MSPAYAYKGNRLRISRVEEGSEQSTELQIDEGNQFANELDHFAQCVRMDREPHTPGEEGLQDQRIIEAIYASASSGQPVKLTAPSRTRGPAPQDDA